MIFLQLMRALVMDNLILHACIQTSNSIGSVQEKLNWLIIIRTKFNKNLAKFGKGAVNIEKGNSISRFNELIAVIH